MMFKDLNTDKTNDLQFIPYFKSCDTKQREVALEKLATKRPTGSSKASLSRSLDVIF